MNHCGFGLKCLQFVIFAVAAFWLICIDALMMLAASMPAGAMWRTSGDRIFLTIVAVGYLLTMTFAMYPGRTPIAQVRAPT